MRNQIKEFIYTYTCSREEVTLCQMELRTIFGFEPKTPVWKSTIEFDPSRSPFIKERIDILYEGDTAEEIIEQAAQLTLDDETFKVQFIKNNDLVKKVEFKERRKMERKIGLRINGTADLDYPKHVFGIVTVEGRWYFGWHKKSEPVWLLHQRKPREYSTALSTRLARAVVNIAVPNSKGVQVIDPCCGIGTVLVEGLSMGIDIVGSDINRIVVNGAQENVESFGYTCDVEISPIEDITKHYDVAIIDIPYNLCTAATPTEQMSILANAKRIAEKVVIISSEPIDEMIGEVGLEIIDRCEAKKCIGFSRQVLVCH